MATPQSLTRRKCGVPSVIVETKGCRHARVVNMSEERRWRKAGQESPLRHVSKGRKLMPMAGKNPIPSSTIPLWEPDSPHAPHHTEAMPPHLVPFLVENARSAVVVCPGGGYARRADHEGDPIAHWLNSLGISALVLHYRVAPHKHPEPLSDAQRALRLVRHHSTEWGIEPNRIGILGFSAGGHLAATLSTHWDGGDMTSRDPVNSASCRPDFAILCYPVISMSAPYAHSGSRKNLLGDAPTPDDLHHLSNETQVTSETPPTFIWHTADDAGVPVEHSLDYARALRQSGVPVSLHVFPHGRHGLGLALDNPEAGQWTGLCASWLKAQGFVG